MGYEPPAVRDGDSPVAGSVPQADGDAGGGQVTAPGGEDRGPVVPPAVVAPGHGVSHAGCEMAGHLPAAGVIATGGVAPAGHPALWRAEGGEQPAGVLTPVLAGGRWVGEEQLDLACGRR